MIDTDTRILRVTEPMLGDLETEAQILARSGQAEVDDAAARTIAGWWASPGAVGRTLAALSTGCEVTISALLDDIHATRLSMSGLRSIDRDGLDMLATWAINRHNPSRTTCTE